MVPCFPLLGLAPSGLFMGLSSTIIYTSELILCSTICVPSATRHNILLSFCLHYILIPGAAGDGSNIDEGDDGSGMGSFPEPKG